MREVDESDFVIPQNRNVHGFSTPVFSIPCRSGSSEAGTVTTRRLSQTLGARVAMQTADSLTGQARHLGGLIHTKHKMVGR